MRIKYGSNDSTTVVEVLGLSKRGDCVVASLPNCREMIFAPLYSWVQGMSEIFDILLKNGYADLSQKFKYAGDAR